MNNCRYEDEKIEYQNLSQALIKMSYSSKIDFANENRKNI